MARNRNFILRPLFMYTILFFLSTLFLSILRNGAIILEKEVIGLSGSLVGARIAYVRGKSCDTNVIHRSADISVLREIVTSAGSKLGFSI